MKTLVAASLLALVTSSAFAAETYVGVTTQGERCEMSVETLGADKLQVQIPVDERILKLEMSASALSHKAKLVERSDDGMTDTTVKDTVKVTLAEDGKPTSFEVTTNTKIKETITMIQTGPAPMNQNFVIPSMDYVKAVLNMPSVTRTENKVECLF